MKTYMPLDGFRWSCDSDSALCDMRQTNVLGRAGGGWVRNCQLMNLMPSTNTLPKINTSGKADINATTQTPTCRALLRM